MSFKPYKKIDDKIDVVVESLDDLVVSMNASVDVVDAWKPEYMFEVGDLIQDIGRLRFRLRLLQSQGRKP